MNSGGDRKKRRRLPVPRPAVEADVEAEFAFHVEMRTRELQAEGLSPEEARTRAIAAFGDRQRHKEQCVELQRSIRSRQKGWETARLFVADMRVASRGLLRRPAFSGLAVLTLGVGIGAVTAIFSLVDATLLRPLPYPEADRIVTLWETHPAQPRRSVAPANFVDWKERARTLKDLSALRIRERTLDGGGRPERLTTGSVTRDFFKAFGVRPPLGRGFDLQDPAQDAPTAVLSHRLWETHFGADPAVLGRTVALDDRAYEIVGVAPAGFEYPRGVSLWTWSPPDLPEAPGFTGDLRTLRDARFISVVGRLTPGSTRASAQAEMDAVGAALRDEYPVENLDGGVLVQGLQEYLVAGYKNTVLLLMAAVGLVLVIACANVANLLLVRAIERRQEVALRSALGATGSLLLRFHLAEAMTLGLSGALVGLGFAWLLIRGATRWAWIWGEAALTLDLRVVGLVLLITGCTTVLFGALPAILVRWSPGSVLGSRGLAGARDKRAGMARQSLLAIEVALAFALVLSTGLAVRTVLNLRAVDLGFDHTQMTTMNVFLGPDPAEPGPRAERLAEVARSLAEDPSVESVAIAGAGPLGAGPWAGLRVEGRDFPPGELPDVGWQFVSSSYFDTFRIPLVRGRVFNSSDRSDAAPVAVINETLARQVFDDVDPVGRRINTGLDGREVWVEVVGVAADTRNRGPAEAVMPAMYRPMQQSAERQALVGIRLRGSTDARTAARLEGLARTAAPDIPIADTRTGDDLVAGYTRATQATLGVLGTLAGLALILSAVGLYGVTSYAVSRRTRDFGVRMALGARASSIIWLVLRETLVPCAIGLAAGLGASLAVGWSLRRMLFEVAPFDALTVGTVGLVMTLVAVAASLGPAARATTLDPANTLRE